MEMEVGQFFGGVGLDSSHEELVRIAPDHPVFRVESQTDESRLDPE